MASIAVTLALPQGDAMLYGAVVFLIIALVAGLFGFGGIAATSVGIARFLFFVFVVIFVVTLILGLARRHRRL
jgi:uncharacterized membrane protein YtjA (UPF0391 family)